jgi:hypothetical protein
MNKAFVREPEDDGRAYCPRCRSLGIAVMGNTLDTHIRPESRGKLAHDAWHCRFPRCEVAYFNECDVVVTVDELAAPIYPKDASASICACFGLTYDDVIADIDEGAPTRIRAIYARSKAGEARCAALAADGQSCLAVVQELYLRMREQS